MAATETEWLLRIARRDLRMRFRCEPSLPVDVIGLIVLLPAPVL